MKREFFSTNEIAQILGMSPFTIRRYISLRKLKAVKLEGSYRVRRADLDIFLKARELEPEEELDALNDAEPPAPPRAKKDLTPQASAPKPPARNSQPKPTPKLKPRATKRGKEKK
ncbi:MAG: helix-turn-helix domain-containing protein [Chloroflexi bacterium]|nr:helix-turn-helix domain-containing protein [Chloroflexota bacterium]